MKPTFQTSIKMSSEIQIQAECWQWCWNTYPQTRKLIFHVPNGGKRNKIEATQLKASGVVAGIPDILFLWNGKLHAFEFKEEKGSLSPAQKELHPIWNDHQVAVTIIQGTPGIEQFKQRITEILNAQY